MKTYEECYKDTLKEVFGVSDVTEVPDRPASIYKFYAYKNGNVLGRFDRVEDVPAGTVKERVHTNKDEVIAYRDKVHQASNLAFERWRDGFRDDYEHLSDDEFDVIFKKAWEEGHSDGYAHVVHVFDDYLQFYKDCMNVVWKGMLNPTSENDNG